MKNNFLKLVSLLLGTAVMFSSCIKDDLVQLTDQGTTRVKIMEAPENKLYFAPFSGNKSVNLFDLRRDVPSNSELNKSTSVKITVVPSYLDAYNEDMGTSYELLPDSLYSTAMAGSGGVFNVTFGPGETAKPFTIQLNGDKWDVSHTYALPFAISDAGGVGISGGMDTVIALLSVINPWDGVYEVNGSMTDNVAPALTGLFPMNIHLITQSTTTVAAFDPDYWGDYFVPIRSGTAVSGYGSFAPVFKINPETNKVVSVTNLYGQPAGNGRYAELDPSGLNYYDPATKTLYVKFNMFQPYPTTLRTNFDWVMKYTGAR